MNLPPRLTVFIPNYNHARFLPECIVSVCRQDTKGVEVVVADNWDRPYRREQAAYPVPGLRDFKFWPAVARVDNVYGDRNLVCSCVGMEAYQA